MIQQLLLSKCILRIRMRRCWKCIEVWKCQNAFIETWIRAAKFSSKIPVHPEDMDKIQSEYPRKGIIPLHGMHTLS